MNKNRLACGTGTRLLTLLMTASCVSALAVAQAQTPTIPSGRHEDAAPAGFKLEEVTVTARRREESLQDTPISVAAFSAETLQQRQVFSTEDLSKITPNLQFGTIAPLSGNSSAAQVFIRGIGQTDPTASVDPGVGIYIDDVYMGSAVGGVMDFRDIANVQVLRGPQGTLFGRNTIGGAVLITTTAPGDEFGGSVRVGIGTDNLRETFAAIDAPVSDTLRTRWTFGSRAQDGYVRRTFDGADLGDVNNYSVTGKVNWDPSDVLTLSFKGDYTNSRERGTPLVFAAINGAQAFPRAVSFAAGCPGMTSVATPVPNIDDPRCANNFWNDGPNVANGTFPLKSTLENWGASVVAALEATDLLTFKSITSYRELKWEGNRDADNTPFPILQTAYKSDGSQFSQELQALMKTASLDGVLGLFYYQQNTQDDLRVTLSPPPAPGGTMDSNADDWDNSNYAAFTQWTWQVFDALSLTGGLRYTSETKRVRPNQFNFDNPTVLYLPRQWFEKKFNATTGSASVQYRWNPSVMTYASWSQGFKSGGMNARFNGVVTSGRPPAFESEEADSREIGAKFDLFDSLRLNVAVFSTEYDNLQFVYRVGTAPLLFNAGKATIEGAEFELQYVPTSAWSIEAGAGYLDAGIDRVDAIVFQGTPSTTAVTTNSKLPYTPQWQGNFAISYTGYTGTLMITPRVDVIYTAKQFFDAANTVEIAQNDAVTLVNLGLRFADQNDRWEFNLGVRDLTDKVYPVAGNSSLSTSAGYAEIAYNRGREGIATFKVNF